MAKSLFFKEMIQEISDQITQPFEEQIELNGNILNHFQKTELKKVIGESINSLRKSIIKQPVTYKLSNEISQEVEKFKRKYLSMRNYVGFK